ncbi:MAG: DNA mismatch repair endonuclease MutL [Armatimonadota bacterium]|nr:DNA mismatch repair endonuclease MutL [Armatimonadota bacterium]MDR7438368.1 DNA mismatch repair endonuclease MutL [Armatimonadota bacterium]MDR7563366.1 DNA mismatch repair endonuclease MutL [Armatimonadota bacterium]MDR7602412.1 DNA mismatch repair endonuclease MutL [Armatimonadota bacterium]
MGKIRVLEPWLADRIAAGEVVERPASAVKELVENALDAGARTITVEIEEGGLRLIRVTDDGEGMDPQDAVASLRRFATSKILSPDDLHRIATLGFRGEALPSIAAVSYLELVTSDGNRGTRVRTEGGTVTSVEEVGSGRGTVVTVRHLFYNTPVRRNFLRSIAREAALCVEVVERLALAYPEVAFRVIRDGEEILWCPASDALDRAARVFRVRPDQLLPIPEFPREVRVTGFVGAPELARRSRTGQYFYVNRRPVHSPLLARAVDQGAHTLIPTGHYPVCAVLLLLPPVAVDPNVHPRKLEVRLAQEDRVYRAVEAAVREAYRSRPLGRIPGGPPPGAFPGTEGRQENLLVREPAGSWPTAQPARPRVPSPLRILGQALRTYIVAESGEGLVLIDQHAAHERVLYEALHDRTRSPGAMQTLTVPASVELSAAEAQLAEELSDALREAGFLLEPFGGNTYLLRAVPAVVRNAATDLLRACLRDLLNGPRIRSMEDVIDRMRITVACHTAVRAGDELTHAEMEALMADLLRCRDPYTCFHGRPTLVVLPRERLESWFLRR